MLQVGGSLCTSVKALQRSTERLTHRSRDIEMTTLRFRQAGSRYIKRRQRQIEATKRYLEKEGIKA